ncbi:MAG: hypothetical protein PHY02_10940 [Phycisphaerae bacterium]|nr:hypothetical protein [Phycisphaerae bacterium]
MAIDFTKAKKYYHRIVNITRSERLSLEIRKKTKFKKIARLALIISAVVLVVAISFFAMLLHKPALYQPLDYTGDSQVSLYLTHDLLPALYNGSQLQEPFDLVVTQSGINDIVARFNWPQRFDGISISAPAVFFSKSGIVLMGTVRLDGAEFVATVIAKPTLDDKGLLDLRTTGVKIGAVDITPLAILIAKRIYKAESADSDDFWTRAVGSLINGEPFEPVFKVDDKKVRVDKITLEQKKLTIHFSPVVD